MSLIESNYNIDYFKTVPKDNLKIKKADEIRFNNTDKQLSQNKNDIVEFVVIHIIDKLYRNYTKKKRKWVYYYYTLAKLVTFNFVNFNANLKNNIKIIVDRLGKDVNYTDMISRGVELIENNAYLFKYSDDKLYDHQKELFTYCKDKRPKLIQYIAPTGTGKTMSPLGISEQYRVIFVCAARHVGLSLAKMAISCHKKVALRLDVVMRKIFVFHCSKDF